MQDVVRHDEYKFSRLMYIIEAALEYFISIAVGTVYLARITAYIGMSDALTGILSSFVSLGCGFQIIAIFLVNKRPVKRWVTAGHIVSQILFGLLYFVPLMRLSVMERTVLFVAILLVAQIVHNMINAPKINWFMSLVDDKKRGKFTANKEIVSLLGGAAFSYGLGFVMDYFEEQGDMRTAFIVLGVGLLVLMALHTCTLVFSKEKHEGVKAVKVKENLKHLMKNRTLFKVILVSVLWNVASYSTMSFTGTYQAKELAFTASFSSLIIIVGSLIRAAMSRPMGHFADRTSFRKMLSICFIIEAVAFGLNIFTAPSNGKWMYFIFYVLYCIGMAGVNSAVINLVFDYVEFDQRTSALALQQTCAGVAGFLITLALSPFISFIQKSDSALYAQQIMSIVSCGVALLLVLYVNTVIRKLKKVTPVIQNESIEEKPTAQEEKKEVVFCPYCGASNRSENVRCSQCGGDLHKK